MKKLPIMFIYLEIVIAILSSQNKVPEGFLNINFGSSSVIASAKMKENGFRMDNGYYYGIFAGYDTKIHLVFYKDKFYAAGIEVSSNILNNNIYQDYLNMVEDYKKVYGVPTDEITNIKSPYSEYFLPNEAFVMGFVELSTAWKYTNKNLIVVYVSSEGKLYPTVNILYINLEISNEAENDRLNKI